MYHHWYTFSKESHAIEEFLEMFWEFHDFRIVDMIYRPESDRASVVLEYDDRTTRVLLQFSGEVSFHVLTVDFETDWMMGACVVVDGKQYKWMQCAKEEAPGINDDVTWFKGNELRWAMVDQSNAPIKLPAHMLHQHFVNRFENREWDRDFAPTPADQDSI